MICFVIYGVNIYGSKHKFNSFEKSVWFIMIFVDIRGNFSMILADFLLPGSGSVSLKRIRIRLTKIKRIQTDPDPDPQHWKQQTTKHLHSAQVLMNSSFYSSSGSTPLTLSSETSFWFLFISYLYKKKLYECRKKVKYKWYFELLQI